MNPRRRTVDAPVASRTELTPNRHALTVTGLSAPKRGTRVLHSVDLEVPKGTIHALIGPNGAGKSTFLRTLAGLIRPASGHFTIEGTASFAFETVRFPVGPTVADLAESLCARGDSGPERAGEALEQVGLGQLRDRRASTLSLGERGRLNLALSLLSDPDILILDEPTIGLDPTGVWQLSQLLVETRERGRTVLLSSHHLNRVADICDFVTFFRAGSVVASHSLDEVRALFPPENVTVVTQAASGRVRGTVIPVAAVPGALSRAPLGGEALSLIDFEPESNAVERAFRSYCE